MDYILHICSCWKKYIYYPSTKETFEDVVYFFQIIENLKWVSIKRWNELLALPSQKASFLTYAVQPQSYESGYTNYEGIAVSSTQTLSIGASLKLIL